MYEVEIISEFNSAHRLRHYKGKCEALHGHNWKVKAIVRSDGLDDLGMVMDFKELKHCLKKILTVLDHKYLNNVPYFKKVNPTSENIAKFIHYNLSLKLKKAESLKVAKVTVWETDTSAASYL
ncbi:MAG: 6-carboxytetrahydropterin synthase QueD [Candidatus Omnitrophica bacterium CG07_land_8_20_14_0_80_42_15]|uniref:6-carboxy-5,6,7,8-tetrahydropterin synthase n=1 Tax=Candidatus Aquitaenariimonas noxiae TaxID=1974741 RepID=A0A2J0KU47_9BACT|nr:MAG: 6-carboxytetrahydropterin synthase QueD [Candidatus Omnitrophica bacterium CG07_land_8_20_14_0_80_42_15]